MSTTTIICVVIGALFIVAALANHFIRFTSISHVDLILGVIGVIIAGVGFFLGRSQSAR